MKVSFKYFLIVLVLGLGSCQKNDVSKDMNDESKLVIDGKTYLIEDLREMMAQYKGVAPERLRYNKVDTSFTVINYESMRFKIVEMLDKYNQN